MKESAKLVFILTVICLLAGLLLSLTNDLTRESIKQAEKAKKMKAIKNVLPKYDNQPDADKFLAAEMGKNWTFFIARKNNKFTGAAFETSSSKGYGGDISIMVGVNADGNIQAIEILKQKETPGLGAKIKDNDFKAEFINRNIEKTLWAVKKDHGDIDEITAATISSRAVVEAIKQGLDVYKKYEAAIQQTGKEQPPGLQE